jgi:hypothetical protein
MSIKGFAFGLIAVVLGVVALLETSGYLVRSFDWGRYQVLRGILLVGAGAYVISRSFKG